MKTIALVAIAFFVIACSPEAKRTPWSETSHADRWKFLGELRSSVSVAKIRSSGSDHYVFFDTTSRSRFTSEFKTNGYVFPSLESAIAFARAKPPGVKLSLAAKPMLVDDANILSAFSDE